MTLLISASSRSMAGSSSFRMPSPTESSPHPESATDVLQWLLVTRVMHEIRDFRYLPDHQDIVRSLLNTSRDFQWTPIMQEQFTNVNNVLNYTWVRRSLLAAGAANSGDQTAHGSAHAQSGTPTNTQTGSPRSAHRETDISAPIRPDISSRTLAGGGRVARHRRSRERRLSRDYEGMRPQPPAFRGSTTPRRVTRDQGTQTDFVDLLSEPECTCNY